MAIRSVLNKVFIGVLITLFSSVLFAQKPRTVSGTLINSDGDGIKGITVLLLSEDGTETNRDETSKKGDFKLKKIPSKIRFERYEKLAMGHVNLTDSVCTNVTYTNVTYAHYTLYLAFRIRQHLNAGIRPCRWDPCQAIVCRVV